MRDTGRVMAEVLVVQHVEPEAPYAIGSACRDAGLAVRIVRTHCDDPVPTAIAGFDGLVVMGGPMSATSDEGYATRLAEIGLVTEALEAAVPVLGVCLGAQLLAHAGGGRVRRGHGPEIGWAPIRFGPAAADDPLFAAAPETLRVLHWHGDTFELPPGATPLAGSDPYPHQAFRIGDAAWGLQFHLEVTETAVRHFTATFAEEAALAPGGAARIVADTPDALAALAPHRREILRRFAALVAARAGDDTGEL